jgi:hypothetical protein
VLGGLRSINTPLFFPFVPEISTASILINSSCRQARCSQVLILIQE